MRLGRKLARNGITQTLRNHKHIARLARRKMRRVFSKPKSAHKR